MPKLNQTRRRFVRDNLKFVKWAVRNRIGRGLLRQGALKLGSLDDVFQLLACEFCRIIASLREDPYDDKVPSFMVDRLASKLKEQINLVRNNKHTDSLDTILEETSHEEVLAYEDGKTCEAEDEVKRLKELIDQAAEPTRTMLLRHLVDGESYPSIARDYNMTAEAVRSRVTQWILVIRQKMESP